MTQHESTADTAVDLRNAHGLVGDDVQAFLQAAVMEFEKLTSIRPGVHDAPV